MSEADQSGGGRVIDSRYFRDVLGCYPTGVCVITALADDGEKLALVVGSFTSISLDPPLVGFFPDKRSATWPKIAATGRFCVNVLSSDQRDVSARFAKRDGARFAELDHGGSPAGLPLLKDTVAWIECSIAEVVEVGDHWLVVGSVEALGPGEDQAPLIFCRGTYHTLTETD